jgi:adenylate cyclase
MLSEGRLNASMREFGEQMCVRIVAAGIPIWRAFCVVGTLHPLVAASGYLWKREQQGTVRLLAEHGLLASPEFMQSPIAAARQEGRTFRRRLADSACPIEFEVLAKFKSEGGTDYLALPMVRSDGGANVVTFLTDYRDGFSDAEVAGLEEIAQVLGLIVELQSSRRTARSLLETYVGPRTGARVLSGAITRGTGETIRAVIWYSDLRGFTALADRLAREQLIALLNEYFEIMVGVVKAEGGEVLKFTGDGMLAIFELCTGEDVSRCCRAALRAAAAAEDGVRKANVKRKAGAPRISFGLALHQGEVYYGNIGAPDRLDFTVVGPAVNHAERLEKIGADLGRIVVTSASFAAAAREPLESLGRHKLRGVAEPQEVFALPID